MEVGAAGGGGSGAVDICVRGAPAVAACRVWLACAGDAVFGVVWARGHEPHDVSRRLSASSCDRLRRRILPGAAGRACGVGAGSCGCCGAGVSAARSRLPPGLLFGPFPGGFLAEALGVQFENMAMMDEAVAGGGEHGGGKMPVHSENGWLAATARERRS